MDKQSIIEYVEETPHNTNRVILNQMLDEFAESSGTGGVQANWEQSDPTATDYVKNRTHYKETTYNALWDNAEATKEPFYYEGEIDGWELRYPDQAVLIDPAKIDFNEPATITINGITKKVYATIVEADFNDPYYLQYKWQYDDDYYFHMYPNRDDEWSYHKIVVEGPVWKMGGYEKFTFSFSLATAIYHTLNDDYLSEGIVKYNNFPQSDWLVTDEKDPRYIKNKTHGTSTGRGEPICSIGYKGTTGQYPYVYMHEGYYWNEGLVFYVGRYDRFYRIDADSNWISQEDGTYLWRPDDYDAYSPWVKINVEYVSIETYKLTITIGGNTAEETYYLWPETITYDKLDENYIPDSIARDVDWSNNNENSPGYINNRTHYIYPSPTEGIVYWYYDDGDEYQRGSFPFTETTYSKYAYSYGDTPPGFWLGNNKYLLNDVLLDETSNWQSLGSDEYAYNENGIYVTVKAVRNYDSKYIDGQYHYGYDLTWNCSMSRASFYRAEMIYKTLEDGYIPDTIVRKSEAQSDYAENDTTKHTYIKNRPFGWFDEIIVTNLEDSMETTTKTYSGSLGCNRGKRVIITINGKTSEGYWSVSSGESSSSSCTTDLVEIRGRRPYEGTWSSTVTIKDTTLTAPYNIVIKTVTTEGRIQQIDEKFIPDIIARKSDLESLAWSDLGEKGTKEQVVLQLNGSFPDGTYDGIVGTKLSVGDECKVNIDGGECLVTVDDSYSFIANYDGALKISYDRESNEYVLLSMEPVSHFDLTITKLGSSKVVEIDEKYIPNTIARAPKATLENVTEAPTAEQYNALLAILRQAGILAN